MSEHEVESVGSTTLTLGTSGSFVEPGDKISLHGVSEPCPPRASRLRTVIESRMLERGHGKNISPKRLVTEYWSLDGKLLAEADKFAGSSEDELYKEVYRLEERIKGYERDTAEQADEIQRLRKENEELKQKVEGKKRARKKSG